MNISLGALLRSSTEGKESVEVAGGTVKEAIADLNRQFPGLQDRICKEGKISRHVIFYVNDEDIRFLDGEDTVLKESDELSLMAAAAGG